MPYLSINLDDPADCRRGVRQLRQHLRSRCRSADDSPLQADRDPIPRSGEGAADAGEPKVPLRQRLARIQQRGVWRFLVQIAQLDPQPRSLPELDAALTLRPNKMRSLKAIMAKLENRLDVRFLRVAPDAGEDASGNPRYVMPPRVRKQIRLLAG